MSTKPLTRRSFLEQNIMTTAGVGMAGAALTNAAARPQESIIPTRLETGQKLRVGILGCGNRSRAHIGAVNHYADFIEISAIYKKLHYFS